MDEGRAGNRAAMKGVVLAGGTGSRLLPLTKVTNKHLLPVGSKAMIDHPVDKLIEAGITDIFVVTGTEHAGAVFQYLGSGVDRGCKFTFRVQDRAGGIAEAIGLAENFAAGGPICVVLGDNVFSASLRGHAERYTDGAKVLLKEVDDPERFGVACFEEGDRSAVLRRIVAIEEKPAQPKSRMAVIGVYFYDAEVFGIIRTLRPSGRGELEVSDINNAYIARGRMWFGVLDGWWTDAGTIESYARANAFAKGTKCA